MKEFFIELFSEEIPYSMHKTAMDQIVSLFTKKVENYLECEALKCYVTPSRITLYGKIAEETKARNIEKRGPQKSATQNAIDGFLVSNNITLDQCVLKEIKGKQYWHYSVLKNSSPTVEIIPEIIEYILLNFKWPKTMRWSSSIKWIRPLRNIFVMYDDKFIPCPMFGISSTNKIESHKLLGSSFIPISFEDYVNKLKESYVILDNVNKKQSIRDQINTIAKQADINVYTCEDLEYELSCIAEYPTVFISSFKEEFLALPKDILIRFLTTSLKVFPVSAKNGELINKFVGVSNIPDTSNPAMGSTKLLNAKLADARFFWEKDKHMSLAQLLESLKTINFYKELGTVYDRVGRISKTVNELSKYFAAVDYIKLNRIIELSKADLASLMVFEYADLCGIVGGYIAEFYGEDLDVCAAIKEQYLPNNNEDVSPNNKYSIIIALADRLEYLMSLFYVNVAVTGSKDPLGLKRAALGVLRIMLDNKLEIPFVNMLQNIANVLNYNVANKCSDFIVEKLINYIGTNDKKVIDAVFYNRPTASIYTIKKAAESFMKFQQTTLYDRLLNIYKRFSKLSEGLKPGVEINDELFRENIEVDLFRCIKVMEDPENVYAIEALNGNSLSFVEAANTFLENVMVNVEDINLKHNRMALMNYAKKCIDKYVNMSYLY